MLALLSLVAHPGFPNLGVLAGGSKVGGLAWATLQDVASKYKHTRKLSPDLVQGSVCYFLNVKVFKTLNKTISQRLVLFPRVKVILRTPSANCELASKTWSHTKRIKILLYVFFFLFFLG